MRIGFCSIYAWRPHVEHLHYLAALARDAGHETRFLACDADLASCYTKELRPERSDFMHCTRCRLGGLRSYERDGVSSIGQLAQPSSGLPGEAEWSRSSAGTVGRFESDADFASAEFRALAERLDAPTRQVHLAARRWIERERLDAVCIFNGRVDATRAVAEAARAAGVPFVSVERTWFGDGLQLLPGENCLGLRSIDRMAAEWRDRPLTRVQALRAAAHVASRFLRRNVKEWRAYNVAAQSTPWPQGGRRRVLLLPGSRNEIWGHPDWTPKWQEPTGAYDALIERLDLAPDEVVLRGHPNWGERIGAHGGERVERYYEAWARRRGVHLVASRDRTSTLALIEQCQAVVVGGGTAALEAGILGKQVIATGPSMFQCAGLQSDAYDVDDVAALDFAADLPPAERAARAAERARRTLRFAYTMVHRVAQYVDHVRALTTTRYAYIEGADPARLVALLRGGALQPDDATHASAEHEESEVLDMIAERRWQELLADPRPAPPAPRRPVHRRWMLKPIDRIREALPRGDL
jgi:hypothetical protein